METYKNIINKRIRKETSMTKNQFGLMPGNSTMESLFCAKQLVEIYKEQELLCTVFIGLKKAHNRVTREV